ncbi:WD-40 repeat-containing protein MSI1 [Vitis vinifera]|uniref:WD-40 repeat-containing protein MSI1 n=1 Tax=Vitis vinifera TaxID=29760 RepID=A0A438GJ68_VITVI|nr:WD-40 repeat-containing protein MSI1 [Vitis vinifera]
MGKDEEEMRGEIEEREEPPGKDYTVQKMILGTHTSENEPNYLMPCTKFNSLWKMLRTMLVSMMMTALMLVVLVAPMASCMVRILILCEVKVSPIGMKDYDF